MTALYYHPSGWSHAYRYVINRELAETKTGELYWKYHATVTNDTRTPARELVVGHLQHAARENAIKEHKSGFGLEKLPTQKFHANWAYLLIGQLAFNLVARFKQMVLPANYHHSTIKTLRHHLLNLAGKIVHIARQGFLMISDSQYNLPEIGKRLANKSNREDVADHFLDPSVRKAIEVDVSRIDPYAHLLGEVEGYLTRRAKTDDVQTFA